MNNLNTTTTNDKNHIIGHPAIFAHPSPREMGVNGCAFTTPNELTFSEDTSIFSKITAVAFLIKHGHVLRLWEAMKGVLQNVFLTAMCSVFQHQPT